MPARDIMTSDPVTITPDASVARAWDLMQELDIRHLPVVQAGALVGIVSERDLAGLAIGTLLESEGAQALQQRLATPITRIMNLHVITAAPESEVRELIELFMEHKVGALPIIDPASRALVGIVSYLDVLRAVHGLLVEVDDTTSDVYGPGR
jgi:acetoin utilization protein AcuB